MSESRMDARSDTALRHHTDFLKFWAGEAVSQVGAQVTMLAIPLTAVLVLQVSPTQVGLLNASLYAPFLAVTLLIGVWVDRVRRRPLMITANVGRAFLVSLVPLLSITGLLRIEFLYVIALLIGVLTVIFEVAYQAYLPTLIQREQLVEGNSKLQATSSLAQMGGPGLAGLLVQAVTPPMALLANAASYAVSVVSLLLIRQPEPQPTRPQPAVPLGRSIAEGLSLVLSNPILRVFVLQSGLYNLCFMSLQTLFVIWAARSLGFGPGSIGLLLGGGAVGSLLGSLVARRLKKLLGLGPAIMVALIACSVSPILVPLAAGNGPVEFAVIISSYAIGGAGGTIANIHIISLRQAITPEPLLGRMTAGYRLISWGTLPVGGLIGGWLGNTFGLRPALFLTAAGFLASVLVVIASSSVRRLSDISQPLEPSEDRAVVSEAVADR